MKKSLILLTALTTLLTPATALADGMVISPPNYYVNENEQKAVIWHDGKTETLILSIVFTGNAADFGWIIPVPAKPEVDKSTDVLFTALEELTRPEVSIQPMKTYGLGMLETADVDRAVTVWQTKKVDIYDISVVSSTESDALAKWFNDHNYPYPRSQGYILDEYVQRGWFFVAAKIDTEKLGSFVEGQLREGHATPLKITFASGKIVYPLKISSITGEHLISDIIKTFSFENGTTEGWRDGFIAGDCRATAASEESYQGIFSLKVPNCNTGTKNVVSYLLAGLTKGRNYVFSAYVKGYPTDSARIGYVSLETLSSGELVSVGSPGIHEWIRFELPFTASSNSQKISIVGDGFTKGSGFYADAIQIELGTEATDFGQTGSRVRGISEEMDRRIPSISPIEPGFMPPRPRPNQVPILLYIFSDHKVDYPGFNTQWASWVKGKTIEGLASDDEGEPWMKTNKKMYLTKLWNSISLAEMTSDLIIKDADDNKPINAPEFFELTSWKFLILFGILAAEVIGVAAFWYHKRKPRVIASPER